MMGDRRLATVYDKCIENYAAVGSADGIDPGDRRCPGRPERHDPRAGDCRRDEFRLLLLLRPHRAGDVSRATGDAGAVAARVFRGGTVDAAHWAANAED